MVDKDVYPRYTVSTLNKQESNFMKVRARDFDKSYRFTSTTPTTGFILYDDGTRVPFDLKIAMPVFDSDKAVASFTFLPKYKRYCAIWWWLINGTPSIRYLPQEPDVSLDDFIQEVLDEQFANEEHNHKIATDPLFKLEEELKRHDWYSNMSDSYSVARSGVIHWQLIEETAAKCPKELADALIKKYQPS